MPEILKPCPFCGAKDIIHHDLRYPKWPDAPSDEDSIKAWNRRASNENL